MFRNLSFRMKLGLILLLPLLTMVLLASVLASQKLGDANQSSRDLRRAKLARGAMETLDSLQVERTAAVRVTAGDSAGDATRRWSEATAEVDGKLANLDGLIKVSAADVTAEHLATLSKVADDIKADRKLAEARGDVTEIIQSYSTTADVLISEIASLSLSASTPKTARQGSAMVAVMQYKEAIAGQNAKILAILQNGKFDIATYGDLTSLVNEEANAITRLDSLVEQTNAEQLAKMASDPTFAKAATTVSTIVAAMRAGNLPAITPQVWADAAEARLAAVDLPDDGVFEEFIKFSRQARDDAKSAALNTLVVAALAMAVAIGSAVFLSSSIARRIRLMSEQANHIVNERLPEVLEAMRHPSPEALAERLPAIDSDSTDELGMLAKSFNGVLRSTVETSLANSQRRAKTMNSLLVNLGRRLASGTGAVEMPVAGRQALPISLMPRTRLTATMK